MSPHVAQFLLDLLNRQQLQVGAPDFDATVGIVRAARHELTLELRDERSDQPTQRS